MKGKRKAGKKGGRGTTYPWYISHPNDMLLPPLLLLQHLDDPKDVKTRNQISCKLQRIYTSFHPHRGSNYCPSWGVERCYSRGRKWECSFALGRRAIWDSPSLVCISSDGMGQKGGEKGPTLSPQVNCASQASLDKTKPDSFVATALECENPHKGLVHAVLCLQICSEVGLVGRGIEGGLGLR